MSRAQIDDMTKQTIAQPPPGFVRGYHMVAPEHALGNISKRRLKVTRYSDANDPFELFALRVEDRAIRNELRTCKDEQDATTGLLCFSERWDSTLMWSHYAAGHRGVCFGFDLQHDFVKRVTYKKARIEIESDDANDLSPMTQELAMKLRCTKSDD
jgi:Protein of unknown function (DUF2971)